MGISSDFKKWAALFLVAVLLVPLVNLYDAYVTPAKLTRVSGNYELISEICKLSGDISYLIYNAQAYILFSDARYLDKFNEYSVIVLKNENDLINQVNSGTTRNRLQELIGITKEYISFVQDEIAPAIEPGNISSLHREQFESLTAELRSSADALFSARNEFISSDAKSLVAGEKRLNFISILLVFLSLALLVAGTRKFIYPMLVNYHHLEKLTEFTKDAVAFIDHRGRITGINHVAETLLGLPATQIKNKSLNDIMVLFPTTQHVLQPLFTVILEQKEVLNNQVVFTGGGRKVLLNVDYHPLFYLDKLSGAVMVAHHVETEKNKRYLFDTIEAERKKISIEIHDWIGRAMSPIIHSLDYILRVHREKMPGDVFDDLVKLRAHCQTAAMDMRGIMNDIHPYLIERVGLISALESYVANFEQMHNIRVYLYYQNKKLHLKKEAEIIIYRIVQEALSNVIKHSNATEVDIYFKEENNTLKVEIMDNGQVPEDYAAGKGLWGMKERANLIGGDLVFGGDESGFSVILTVPASTEGDRNEQD
jgi:PAS domain S-box-containing protein